MSKEKLFHSVLISALLISLTILSCTPIESPPIQAPPVLNTNANTPLNQPNANTPSALLIQHAKTAVLTPKDEAFNYTLELGNAADYLIHFGETNTGEQAIKLLDFISALTPLENETAKSIQAVIPLAEEDQVMVLKLSQPEYIENTQTLIFQATILKSISSPSLQFFQFRPTVAAPPLSIETPAVFMDVRLLNSLTYQSVKDLLPPNNPANDKVVKGIFDDIGDDIEDGIEDGVDFIVDGATDAYNEAKQKAEEAKQKFNAFAQNPLGYTFNEFNTFVATMTTNPQGLPFFPVDDFLEYFPDDLLTEILPDAKLDLVDCSKQLFDTGVDIIPEQSSEHENWMTEDARLIANLTLKSLAIPGAHDSATYPLNGNSELTPELLANISDTSAKSLAQTYNELKKTMPLERLNEALAVFAKAQRHSVSAQLQAGIRYLDLRVLLNDDQQFYIEHAMFADKLDLVLEQILKFSAQHPQEVIILDFQRVRDMNLNALQGQNLKNLQQKITGILGSKMLPSDTIPLLQDLTLKQIWEKKRPIIALLPFESNVLDSSEFWPRETHLWSDWPNLENISQIKDHLKNHVLEYKYKNEETEDKKIHQNGKERLVVFQGQITLQNPSYLQGMVLWDRIGREKHTVECLKTQYEVLNQLLRGTDPGDPDLYVPLGSFGQSTLDAKKRFLDKQFELLELIDSERRFAFHRLQELLKINTFVSLKDAASNTNPEIEAWLKTLNTEDMNILILDYLADYPSIISHLRELNKQRAQ